MNAIHMLVASRMADRLREADNERLAKLASHQRPSRAPRSIVNGLAATRREAKVAERPA